MLTDEELLKHEIFMQGVWDTFNEIFDERPDLYEYFVRFDNDEQLGTKGEWE